MGFLLWLLASSLVAPVAAAEPPTAAADAQAAAVAAQAEYVRLNREIEKLAARNAWVGVERAYADMLALGAAPGFDDHVAGANAARSIGDTGKARERLLAANAMREDRVVIDWLWQIDSNYGMVSLDADHGAALSAEAIPFEPDQARSVEFAIRQVDETGTFHGYLPQGRYSFAGRTIDVQPRVTSISIDVRTGEARKPPRKRNKK